MTKWFLKISLILVAFIASYYLVFYLNHNKLYLPNFMNQFIRYFNDPAHITDTTPVDVDEPLKNPYGNIAFVAEEISELRSPSTVCIDHSLGELDVRPKNGIYTWKDDEGIVNFSDKKPVNNDFEKIVLAHDQVFDFFSLNVTGLDIPFEFTENLTHTLNKMFAVYGQLIEKRNLKKVSVNLKFIASKKAYERYRAKHAPSLKSAIGFYNNATNEAVILYSNPKRAFKTAVHESAHAINRGVIGRTNKWLNEGLAEYLETMTTNLSSAEIAPNPDWFRNGKLINETIQLADLLSITSTQWNKGSAKHLYSTSWAFIYFLMDDTDRKASLAKLITLEQSNMCDQLKINQVLNSIGMTENALQNSFLKWLNRADKFPHII